MATTSDMATSPESTPRKRIVVVGLGMVGIAFIEKLIKLDTQKQYEIIVIGEEPHVAYNRVGLTSFFTHREVEQLYLNPVEWYKQHLTTSSLTHHLSTTCLSLSPSSKTLTISPPPSTPSLSSLSYDHLVLATGSRALLPTSTPGHDSLGVFVYRTISDLQNLISWSTLPRIKGSTGVVVGGGLLGLEAAKALTDLGVYGRVVVIERNGWVLARQVDEEAGGLVVEGVRGLGVEVLTRRRVKEVDCDSESGERRVKGIWFEDGEYLACSTICFAIGIKPRDELAREAGIACSEKGGGIVVDDSLATSAPDVYAIGECASWQGQTFGLIGPGVEMADVLAFNLTQAYLHTPRVFKRPDLSTKLKLLGVEVASFGDFFADRDGPKYLPPKVKRDLKKSGGKATVKALTYKDPFSSVYKKYIFTSDGKYLLGGMMIGDTTDYVRLVPLVKTQKALDIPPSQLILGAKKDSEEDDDLPDDTQICSCHNVTKADLVSPLKSGACTSLGDLKSCTKAGTGCGGCMPLVQSIFNRTMSSLGTEVKNNLCPHFPTYSRADLYNIISVKRLRTLPDVMREAGADADSLGCEVCKPAIASIFASLWNDHVMSPAHHGLQDTNDRFMGNIQRNGTFSVVPRVAAGEITPEKLIVIGEVAREYNLYTKITGGQRIDMFGARKQDLLQIWKKLVDAGMESGHAYAKSLRTVKSCVGTTWCRFGVGDSVGMAVRLEERYKGLRAPHKIKGGVSGCVRECAEAGNKDFGLIATDKGFNILIAGNGGTTPRHSVLLAKDVPPTQVIPIIDRYLMFYIRTADKLQRTARWLEALPGGIDYLKEVILDDRLGICASLEAQMQELVDSYFDEWAEAINNPAMQERFKQFANTDEGQPPMEVEIDRGQERPVMWPREDEGGSAKADFKGLREKWSSTTWQPVLEASYFKGADELPNGISASIKRGDTQLAVWRIKGKYYASQQMCPHKRTFALSDGLVGTEPSSCPSSALPPSPPTTPPASSPSTSPPHSPTSSTAPVTSCSTNPQGPTSPWISCPFHKRNFSLTSGSCKNDTELSIATFDVEEREDGMVYIKLPPVEELDRELGTKKWMVKKGEAGEGQLNELDELNKRKGIEGKKGRRGRKPGASEAGKEVWKKLVEAVGGGSGGCGGGPELEW
ncbi:nitrite reductase [Sordaria brevicollis]|uniref:Nitrite reductase [NAD(P)H] n=1 Tax=Sordaria brevicollis TaxID=83679 RepID=A0AAE0PMH3_SORBR|nr:nitrite reductase [Sordaria brevicollis]